jgi:hypothetical protein
MSGMNDQPDPQKVQNTVNAWLTLEMMAQDRNTYPTLGAEMREAQAKVAAGMWKKTAMDLGFKPLQAVEDKANDG